MSSCRDGAVKHFKNNSEKKGPSHTQMAVNEAYVTCGLFILAPQHKAILYNNKLLINLLRTLLHSAYSSLLAVLYWLIVALQVG